MYFFDYFYHFYPFGYKAKGFHLCKVTHTRYQKRAFRKQFLRGVFIFLFGFFPFFRFVCNISHEKNGKIPETIPMQAQISQKYGDTGEGRMVLKHFPSNFATFFKNNVGFKGFFLKRKNSLPDLYGRGLRWQDLDTASAPSIIKLDDGLAAAK